MIIDIQRFVETERKYWEELETILRSLENNPDRKFDLAQLKRFHYLYERASADLGKITTFASERDIRSYLESLVARAYGEIHETREKQHHFHLRKWLLQTFPQTFRNHINGFWLALAITIAGFLFGGVAISVDQEAKAILMPFPHLQESPRERVKKEEEMKEDPLAGQKASFSSYLMTHNTKVGIMMLALGMTWGVGTILLLFYNGVILGAVAVDYILADETKFLLGWLLPHGVIEIPAILIAGQAGLLLATALIGRGNRAPLRARLREISSDLFTLIAGVGLLLVWAGTIESFLSQYHEPIIPYLAKIAFGLVELLVLSLFLFRSGRNAVTVKSDEL
jgi:uncharacterized membrane protein SpoIIM required for sporulation